MAIAHPQVGALQGEQGRGVVRFRGIPYASATRFGPPVPVSGWTGTLDATRHGPIGPQPRSRLALAMGDYERPQAEDCLSLTIATPGLDGARPVLVFLHGGAYWTGAGSLDWYDGGVLAAENRLVVVSVNYRLGVVGFLAHPQLSPGNRGIEDMEAALAWVQANIAAFGGDPGNVTVAGQSAGAHAIHCLLTRPSAKGLFHRAMMMSGIPRMAPMARGVAADVAERMAAHLGLPLRGLLGAPMSALIEANIHMVRAFAGFADIGLPLLPVVDGDDEAVADPVAFLKAGAEAAAARQVDILIGATREEMHAFFAPDPGFDAPDPALVAAKFAELAGNAGAIEVYRARRPDGTVRDLVGDLVTDHMFRLPAEEFAAAARAAGARVHTFSFDWAAPGNKFKACHCIDLPFLFGNFAQWPDAAMLAGGDPAAMEALSARMRAAVAGFATDGNPGEASPLIFA